MQWHLKDEPFKSWIACSGGMSANCGMLGSGGWVGSGLSWPLTSRLRPFVECSTEAPLFRVLSICPPSFSLPRPLLFWGLVGIRMDGNSVSSLLFILKCPWTNFLRLFTCPVNCKVLNNSLVVYMRLLEYKKIVETITGKLWCIRPCIYCHGWTALQYLINFISSADSCCGSDALILRFLLAKLLWVID